jgi:hypothetical protein
LSCGAKFTIKELIKFDKNFLFVEESIGNAVLYVKGI